MTFTHSAIYPKMERGEKTVPMKLSLKISQKMWLFFLGIAILFILTVGVFYSCLKQIDKSNSDLINQKVAILRNTDNIQISALQQIESLRAFLLTGDQNHIKAMESANGKLTSILEHMKSLELSDEEQLHIKNIGLRNKSFIDTARNVIPYHNSSAKVKLISSFADMPNKFAKDILIESKILGDLVQKEVDQQIDENNRKVAQIFATVLPLCFLSLLLLSFIAWIVSRMVVKPVVMMSEAAKKIASGDLTIDGIKVKNKDEIGELAQSFHVMTRNLRHLIGEVGSHGEQVAVSAEELTASAEQTSHSIQQIVAAMQEVATGVDKQVESVEEASRTVLEMSLAVQQITNRVQEVSSSANQASAYCTEGGLAIQTVVRQMNLISQTVSKLALLIKGLGEHSKEIHQIIEVITGISAQTNLLSLNAAIEAARAGAHGRGFAVVADEVRKLAEQSAQSAQQVTSLIAKIFEDTTKAVQTMEVTRQEVISGIELVNRAGDSFTLIQQTVSEVTTQIQDVSSAVQQVAAGSEQMALSMKLVKEIAESAASGIQEVSAATQEQTASMGEISTSTYSLSKKTEQLQMLIGKFRV